MIDFPPWLPIQAALINSHDFVFDANAKVVRLKCPVVHTFIVPRGGRARTAFAETNRVAVVCVLCAPWRAKQDVVG